MKIKDILKEKTPHISFEVFPPKTDAGFASVLSATDQIGALKPSYMSVTYGAGGGTSKNTVNIAYTYQRRLGTYQSGASDMRFFYKRTCSTRN